MTVRHRCFMALAAAVAVGVAPQPSIAQPVITTIAGNGTLGSSGDGGPGTAASVGFPEGVAVDANGTVYFADSLYNRVRKVDASGTISTAAGNGLPLYGGDGGAATAASLSHPTGVAVDSAGNLYIADSFNNRVRKVDSNGIITTFAGNGTAGFSGDGGPATSSQLQAPGGVATDRNGNVYIADTGTGRIRKVDTRGTITTVAGNGAVLFAGDGGPAVNAQVGNPNAVAVDSAGNLFISDFGNGRIRKVDAGGTITTIAGNGLLGSCPETGPAISVGIRPQGVAVDAAGNVYVADTTTGCIREVTPSGTIVAVAGGGNQIPGEGGPATSAGLGTPSGVAVDSAGNLYFTDKGEFRVRKVALGGSSGTPGPKIFSGGIVNGASFAKAPAGVVPGSIASIFGTGFSQGTFHATQVPLPTTLGDVKVTMNGIAAPLFVVTPGQINAQVPWELLAATTDRLEVQVVSRNVASAVEVTSDAGQPGVFSTLENGNGPGVITHADGTLVTVAKPAAKGEVVIVYCTALGDVDNRPPSGSPALADPLSRTVYPTNARVNNLPAAVSFAGLAPGFVGLYQVNVQVPPDVVVPAGNPDGPVVPLVVESTGFSNAVEIAVE